MKSCEDKAFELLARRAHFILELRRKLEQRGYGGDEVEAALARLKAAGHLEDGETAELYVAGRLRRGGIGPLKLIAELRQRGVEESVAQGVVDAMVDDEGELARAAAARWRRARGPRRAGAAALARHLQGAGFRGHLVAELVRSHASEEDETSGELDG